MEAVRRCCTRSFSTHDPQERGRAEAKLQPVLLASISLQRDTLAAIVTMAVAVLIALVVDRLVIGRGTRVAARLGEVGVPRVSQPRLRVLRRLVFARSRSGANALGARGSRYPDRRGGRDHRRRRTYRRPWSSRSRPHEDRRRGGTAPRARACGAAPGRDLRVSHVVAVRLAIR